MLRAFQVQKTLLWSGIISLILIFHPLFKGSWICCRGTVDSPKPKYWCIFIFPPPTWPRWQTPDMWSEPVYRFVTWRFYGSSGDFPSVCKLICETRPHPKPTAQWQTHRLGKILASLLPSCGRTWYYWILGGGAFLVSRSSLSECIYLQEVCALSPHSSVFLG